MMSKPFAVFDIDGTLIRWQLYHAIADSLAKHGHIDEATYETIHNARMAWKKREQVDSFKDYEMQLVHAYDKTLQKLTVEQFEEAASAVFEEYKDQVYTYTRDLIQRLKKQGYLLFAISGSQSEIVEKVAQYHKFDDYVGSRYGRSDGKFTGEKDFAAENKAKLLKTLVSKHGASWPKSIAVGDSESDIPMLEAVERAIAFNPTKNLFEHARTKGWQITVERKNVVYELRPGHGSYVLA